MRTQWRIAARRLRQPLTEMKPRRLFSSSSRFRDRLRLWWQNGTIQIAFGLTILGLLGIDQIFQYQQESARNDMLKRLELELSQNKRSEEKWKTDLVTKTPLFDCVVRRLPTMFDGPKCLKDVQVGDVVHVLEERVGPHGMYNLCRKSIPQDTGKVQRKQEVSIGWFPMSCLEKVETKR